MSLADVEFDTFRLFFRVNTLIPHLGYILDEKASIEVNYFFFTPCIVDINECLGSHGCHPNASCVNNPGSYECKCKPNFVGDGKSNCVGEQGFLFLKAVLRSLI